MNLSKILNAKTGGQLRMALSVALAVITALAAIVDRIDWNSTPSVILIAIVQLLAHRTPLGD